ncbi:MAG: AraC family transcriptional regulator [Cocleimonas sp.]
MNYLVQIQKSIDYIEAHLDSELSLVKIAQHAGISQWHFQRIFKALSNETLKTYIRSRRLSNALEQLLSTDNKIIDIALTAGFESQQSFTRAFKNTFDMTPNQARKIGNKNIFQKKIEFNSEYLQHINNNVSLVPEIYTQPKIQCVGLRTQFYSVDSEKNNLADKLPALWDEFIPRMSEIENRNPDIAYGVIQQTKDKTDLLEYYAVCEVNEVDRSALPQGMEVIEIAESSYAKFTHKGNVKNINDTVNYIYSSWLMQSNKKHSYAADLEIYGDDYREDSDESIIHYAIPIE